jgi:hypothetical protein
VENKYVSRYGATRKIGAPQFLAEFIMERQAKREKTVLPVKFWDNPNWSKQFLAQVVHANKLLKEYTCLEIITALKTKRGETIYSLGNKKSIEELLKRKIKIESASTQGLDTNTFIIDDDSEEEICQVPQRKNLWEELS